MDFKNIVYIWCYLANNFEFSYEDYDIKCEFMLAHDILSTIVSD